MKPLAVSTTVLLGLLLFPGPASIGQTGVTEENRITAGAARVNITPPVGSLLSGWAARDHGSTGLADPLYARALVIGDGRERVAIVAADILGLPGSLVAETRRLAEEATGIPASSIMIAASHTHFGPDLDREKDYAALLPGSIAGAVKIAADKMDKAWLGAGTGRGDALAFNRRTIRPDGTIAMSWRYPPPDSLFSFGPVDNSVGLLKVVRDDGRAVAGLINFACHPVCGMNRMYDLSADYPGRAMGLVERETGAIALFGLGTAGNLVPIERDLDSRQWIGTALGAEALRLWQHVRTRGGFTLAAEARQLVLPGRDTDTGDVQTEIQAIALGDITLLGLPGEVFVEIGLRIKRESEGGNLFVISLANDYIGYIIHAEAHSKGGYEDEVTRLAPNAEDILVNESLALVRRVQSRTEPPRLHRPRVEDSAFANFSSRWQEERR